MQTDRRKTRIAVGPALPGIGSWEWIGADLTAALPERFTVVPFGRDIPPAELVLIIKYDLRRIVPRVPPHVPVVYCPVDAYGSSAEIDRDWELLRHCARVVLHASSLRPYFQSYSRVECLDHHIRFAAPLRQQPVDDGPVLWVGHRSNLPPLVEWVNRHSLPAPLVMLTNLEGPPADPAALGFRAGTRVTVEPWSAERQRELTSVARAAIDIRGDDFRAWHKPPAKAIDFVASGVPLAMKPGSSAARHLRQLGLELADPEDSGRWFSREYQTRIRQMGEQLRGELSREQVAARLAGILDDVLDEDVSHPEATAPSSAAAVEPAAEPGGGNRVCVLSFLFNWPSTGGGIVHTVELVQSLQRAGFEVDLVCPDYGPWRIGQVAADCPVPVQRVEFREQDWTVPRICQRFRETVEQLRPDSVIITDCWNFKPHLVQALGDYRVLLRMQASECLCPLNNLRVLPSHDGLELCPHDQLAEPAECFHCLVKRGAASGALHQAERQLSAVGTPEYDALLRKSLQQAAAVLVLNPEVADSFRPWCRRVEVVTWGMDPARFPPPDETSRTDGTVRLLFAGLPREAIKGFDVVHAACRLLWQRRRDFQLVATGDSHGPPDPFTRMIGWQSQAELPAWYRQTEICVVPTIAPDGLSRTSVEAMASGRPVIASRIGGLPFTVDEGRTGLLCRPGDPEDWAIAIERLLDDPALRRRMGAAGRAEFERRFCWEDVIERSYRPLLTGRGDDRPLSLARSGSHGGLTSSG